MRDVQVMGYGMEYPTLNLKLKNEDEKIFDYLVLHCYTKECEKGFKVKRIFKTTNKGTKVNYVAIKDKDDFEEYKKVIQKMVEDFNSKYKSDVKVG